MQQTSKSTPGSVSQFYATRLEGYDEMYAGEGQLLPHWQALMQELDQLGREGLERRRHEAQRLLRENGVTFNVQDGAARLRAALAARPDPAVHQR